MEFSVCCIVNTLLYIQVKTSLSGESIYAKHQQFLIQRMPSFFLFFKNLNIYFMPPHLHHSDNQSLLNKWKYPCVWDVFAVSSKHKQLLHTSQRFGVDFLSHLHHFLPPLWWNDLVWLIQAKPAGSLGRFPPQRRRRAWPGMNTSMSCVAPFALCYFLRFTRPVSLRTRPLCFDNVTWHRGPAVMCVISHVWQWDNKRTCQNLGKRDLKVFPFGLFYYLPICLVVFCNILSLMPIVSLQK